jgi:[acyl-carrier-protein] S-malonyltransferase
MKIAFVFPGQGSQSVGMLSSFAGNVEVDQTLAQASAALGEDLASLIANGPADQLDTTVNTQPCMLTASVAMFRAYLAAGGAKPQVFAGHSLGEYAALVAAGVFTLEQAVPLVRFRAQVMQQAVPLGTSGMAAILGLDDDKVREACHRAQSEARAAGQADAVVEAANFNAPSQVVIGGHTAALTRACDIAKELGAKRALPLPVSVAFHSSLLTPASERLRERLAATSLQSPHTPVMNNIDVRFETQGLAIADALARQVAGPVRWTELVNQLVADGVTHLVECGPGKVLTGLNKRIAPGLTLLSISDAASLADVVASLQGAA